jgi:hypothetical protein
MVVLPTSARALRFPVPRGAQHIDAMGKFPIPGLCLAGNQFERLDFYGKLTPFEPASAGFKLRAMGFAAKRKGTCGYLHGRFCLSRWPYGA